MLNAMVRAALAECARKRIFPLAQLMDVFAWIFEDTK